MPHHLPHIKQVNRYDCDDVHEKDIDDDDDNDTGVRRPATPPDPPRREGRPESEEEGAAHQETSQCIHALYEGEEREE